jgi:hypothetical protein
MRAVAERLGFGKAAAAKRHRGSATKTERLTLLIHHFEISLDSKRTIVPHRDFCSGH